MPACPAGGSSRRSRWRPTLAARSRRWSEPSARAPTQASAKCAGSGCDGLHVTLRFIGPTLDRRIPAALEAVRVAASETPPFEVGLAGAGAFPDAIRPRALWLGIGTGVDELSALTRAIDRELSARGWPVEERPFRPHLTLARSDGVGTGSRTAARLMMEADGLDVRWNVDRVVLFESVTGGGPARYVPIGEGPLAEAAPR